MRGKPTRRKIVQTQVVPLPVLLSFILLGIGILVGAGVLSDLAPKGGWQSRAIKGGSLLLNFLALGVLERGYWRLKGGPVPTPELCPGVTDNEEAAAQLAIETLVTHGIGKPQVYVETGATGVDAAQAWRESPFLGETTIVIAERLIEGPRSRLAFALALARAKAPRRENDVLLVGSCGLALMFVVMTSAARSVWFGVLMAICLGLFIVGGIYLVRQFRAANEWRMVRGALGVVPDLDAAEAYFAGVREAGGSDAPWRAYVARFGRTLVHP